jgi:hypothetical protein
MASRDEDPMDLPGAGGAPARGSGRGGRSAASAPPAPQPAAPAGASALRLRGLAAPGAPLVASILPPEDGPRQPIDVVFVLDLSGSMGAAADLKGGEVSGLTVWQLVAHATRTVLAALNEGDRAGIVIFSEHVRTIIPLT